MRIQQLKNKRPFPFLIPPSANHTRHTSARINGCYRNHHFWNRRRHLRPRRNLWARAQRTVRGSPAFPPDCLKMGSGHLFIPENLAWRLLTMGSCPGEPRLCEREWPWEQRQNLETWMGGEETGGGGEGRADNLESHRPVQTLALGVGSVLQSYNLPILCFPNCKVKIMVPTSWDDCNDTLG